MFSKTSAIWSFVIRAMRVANLVGPDAVSRGLHGERGGGTSNIQHPTSNIEHPMGSAPRSREDRTPPAWLGFPIALRRTRSTDACSAAHQVLRWWARE